MSLDLFLFSLLCLFFLVEIFGGEKIAIGGLGWGDVGA